MFWNSLFHLSGKREIYRVLISHTARSVASSFVSVYIPIYFLNRGHSLSEVILYYALLHSTGLFMSLTLIPHLIQCIGLIRTFKINYILEIIHLILLFSLPVLPISFYWIAPIAGAATFFYWIPLNILLMKNADFDKMGTDLAKFFFLPKFFGVFGPLIGAALVYFIGFWPTFLIAMTGVVLSYLPLVRIDTSGVQVTFHWSDAIAGLRRRKGLFVLECLENLLEESAWFWGIYVFLILGSLEVPGIAGALSAIGAAFFTLFVGKKVNASPRQFVVISALGLSLVFLSQVFARGALDAYIISLVLSFAFSAFMVAYSSVIYREVKGNEEEEFVILREVPVVLGRLIGFIAIILFATHPRAYFFLPMTVALMLTVQFLLRGTLGVSLKHS